jgi:hypothetical protein
MGTRNPRARRIAATTTRGTPTFAVTGKGSRASERRQREMCWIMAKKTKTYGIHETEGGEGKLRGTLIISRR